MKDLRTVPERQVGTCNAKVLLRVWSVDQQHHLGLLRNSASQAPPQTSGVRPRSLCSKKPSRCF